MVVLSSSYTTPAAAAEATSETLPQQWTWDPTRIANRPQAATSGTPLVKQYRDGQLLATYSILGGGSYGHENSYLDPYTPAGPFSRSPYRNWADGDVFEVYPAVYSGVNNQPWIGPMVDTYAEYLAGVFHTPQNITIRGITVDGVRPVITLDAAGASNNTLGQSLIYVGQSVNLTIENIDIDGSAGGFVGKAAVYLNGAQNITLRDMRIHGFREARANGIFATDNNSETIGIEGVEFYDNGGDGGPEHNVYINASASDPAFTVYMKNSWSHEAFYGHLFKSRAQVNILEGNYFQGGVPQSGESQAEAYLVDVPNGGLLTMRNNVLVKNRSGYNSNGASISYAMEGLVDGRPLGITIENNTFVAFTEYYDDSHQVFPFQFFYPRQVPGSADFPVDGISVQRNMFVGYRDSAFNPWMNYRGELALIAGFMDINHDFSPKTDYVSTDMSILGTPAYSHAAQLGQVRHQATIGAVDQRDYVVQDGFETGQPSPAWNSVWASDGRFDVVKGIAHTGQYSIRSTQQRDEEMNTLVLENRSIDEIYVRFWEMYPQGYNEGNFKRFYLDQDEGTDGGMCMSLQGTGSAEGFHQMNVEIFASLGENRPWIDWPTPAGRWTKVALYAKFNTPGQRNGIFRLWRGDEEGDELVAEYTDVSWRNSWDTADGLRIGGNFSAGGLPFNPFDVYVDDVYIARTPDGDINPADGHAPTLDPIASFSLPHGGIAQMVPLWGISPGAADQQIVRLAAASNALSLIPDPTVQYVAGQTSGSLSFTPVAGQFGTSTITVTVTDPGVDGRFDTPDDQSFQRQFDVTVAAAQSLGTVSRLEQHGQETLGRDLWYTVRAARPGYLTVEALGMTRMGVLELYDANVRRLDVSTSSGHNQRVDAIARAAGQVFYLKLHGEAGQADLRWTNLVRWSGGVMTVAGTGGEDAFTFRAGPRPSITVDEVSYSVPAGTMSIRFDSAAGSDSATLIGALSQETVSLGPGSGTWTGGGLSVTLARTEKITVYGQGGDDTAYLRGLAGSESVDNAYLYPAWTKMAGEGYTNQVRGFGRVNAYGVPGSGDIAYLYDSAGNDTLVAKPAYACLTGEGFFNYTTGFGKIYAYATATNVAGATDIVRLYDSTGSDTFYSYPTYAYLTGTGFYNYAKGFDKVYAYATAMNVSGATDQANLYDSTGSDRFYAYTTYALLYGTGFYSYASGFDKVYGFAKTANVAGAIDRAFLFDSVGNDTFYGRGGYGYLYGAGFYNFATGFNEVTANGTKGGTNRLDIAALDYLFHHPGIWI